MVLRKFMLSTASWQMLTMTKTNTKTKKKTKTKENFQEESVRVYLGIVTLCYDKDKDYD